MIKSKEAKKGPPSCTFLITDFPYLRIWYFYQEISVSKFPKVKNLKKPKKDPLCALF